VKFRRSGRHALCSLIGGHRACIGQISFAVAAAMASLIAIKYDREGGLHLLDQRLLPHQQAWLEVQTPQAAWKHIKDMVVRGAPVSSVPDGREARPGRRARGSRSSPHGRSRDCAAPRVCSRNL
jgi:hypothetical protein